jgi:epoxyqueuosine reductase
MTPDDLREPMGMWVYGCDRCQNVCPRNQAWSTAPLPPNEKVFARADDFDLSRLLAMDARFFRERIWPHMFYMPEDDLWRWHMNVARAMGNSGDPKYIPDLVSAIQENRDPRVRGMAAWALGRMSGGRMRPFLESRRAGEVDSVKEEIEHAIAAM